MADKRNCRIFIRAALCLCGAYFFYTVARTNVLLKNAKTLIANAEKFPREYSVGDNFGEPEQREIIYVALGDSTAVGVGAARLNETHAFQIATTFATLNKRRVRVINLAVSGSVLNDVLQKQLPQLAKFKPDLITVSIGANDATHFSSMGKYQAQMQVLVSKLSASKAQVSFATTPDMYQAPALVLPLALAVNRRAKMQNAILEKAIGGSQIKTVDLFNRGKLIYAQNPNLYAADFFHPSSGGYQIWARLFIADLAAS